MIRSLFPVIYDTKVLATEFLPRSAAAAMGGGRIVSTALGPLYQAVCRDHVVVFDDEEDGEGEEEREEERDQERDDNDDGNGGDDDNVVEGENEGEGEGRETSGRGPTVRIVNDDGGGDDSDSDDDDDDRGGCSGPSATLAGA